MNKIFFKNSSNRINRFIKNKFKHGYLINYVMITALALLLPFSASAQFSGNGAEDDPYIISSTEDLVQFSAIINNGELPYSAEGVHYRLIDNIDLSGFSWIPIGMPYDFRFKGIFDGNTKIVTGLTIDAMTFPCSGLFGYVSEEAIVKNLGVENINMTATSETMNTYIGGIAGNNQGTIINCYTTGIMNGSGFGENCVGGIVGVNSGSISYCYSTASVSSSDVTGASYIGGIVGYNFGNVLNCFSTGIVSAFGAPYSAAFLGGIAGYHQGAILSNCAALNPALNSYVTTQSRVGRVVGHIITAVSSNIAFTRMSNINDTTWENIGNNRRDGESIDVEIINSDGTLNGHFFGNGWTILEGKLPGLFSNPVDMPDHLLTIDFTEGNGTAADPFIINNKTQILQLAALVNTGNTTYNSMSYKLGDEDFDFSESIRNNMWIPIGKNSDGCRFTGHFDGNGIVIKNLTINNIYGDYQGLFGYITNASIINLGLENFKITARNFVGSLVGNVGANSYIENCYVTYTPDNYGYVSGVRNIGGLIGSVTSTAPIQNCYTTCEVTGSFDNVGGIVGYGLGVNMTNCYATGNVSGGNFVGGLVGLIGAEGTIINCVAANANVSAMNGTNVSRIVGNTNGYLSNNYAFQGMVVMVNDTQLTITEGADTQAGESVSLDTLTNFEFYNSDYLWHDEHWDMTLDDEFSVWKICNNISFPYLHWQEYYECRPVIIATSGSNGTISPNGHITVIEGDTYFEFSPKERFTIDALYIDGEEIPLDEGVNFYTLSYENINRTIHVTFKLAGFNGGNGTIETPYEIDNIYNLEVLSFAVNAVNDNENGNATTGKYFILTNNIDFYDYGDGSWPPIGNADANCQFEGIFDGNGKVVKNISINTFWGNHQGLFGYINGATIKNLGVVNCQINGNDFVGGLVGYGIFSNIENCYTTGYVNGNSSVGGLAGLSNSIIKNCYSNCNVTGSDMNIGGLVGQNNGRIENCYATGNVHGIDYVGGLAGDNHAGSIIQNSIAANAFISTANESDFINRITAGSGTLQNNYAFDGMIITSIDNQLTVTEGLNTQAGASKSFLNSLTDMEFYKTPENWLSNQPWDIEYGIDETITWNMCNIGSLPYFQWQEDYECNPVIIATAGINGNISQSGYVYLIENDDFSFSINPDVNYVIDSLWIDGFYEVPLLEDNSYYTFENVTSNHTIHVTFKLDGFCGGNGTEASPYEICDAETLAYLAEFVNNYNGNETLEKYFILTNDIDLIEYSQGEGWESIGSAKTVDCHFQGFFNGNGKIVSNLFINSTEYYQGLFGYINNAVIKNIGIEECNISGALYVGGLVGYCDNSIIENCYATGEVNGQGNVGGLVGSVQQSSIIRNCYSTCNVNGSTTAVGGLVGSCSSTVEYCYASGNITGDDFVGGLIGYNSDNCYIQNCVAVNNMLTSTGGNVNRIAGYDSNSTIINNYAKEDMIINNKTTDIIKGLNTIEGESKPLQDLKNFDFYNTDSNWYEQAWSIDLVPNPIKNWKICVNATKLPFLQWENRVDCSSYVIFASATGNGTIEPCGYITVTEGESITFTFTPENDNYRIYNVLIDDENNENAIIEGSYTFTDVSDSHTIEAVFDCIGGTTGDLEWKLCPDGTLTIWGEGYMPDYSSPIFPSPVYFKDLEKNGMRKHRDSSPWNDQGDFIVVIIIEYGVMNIGSNAFSGLANVNYVSIPGSVKSIGEGAFAYSTGIPYIEIPNSVTSVGSGAFAYCSGMTNIIVDEENPNYSSMNGVFFNKEMASLIQYPSGKKDVSYTIPATVSTIESGAFAGSIYLSEIKIDENNPYFTTENGAVFNTAKTILVCYPSGKEDENYVISSTVTTINDYAFSGCNNLKCVTIPESVTSIGDFAYWGCGNLELVFSFSEIPPVLGNHVFYGMNNAVLAVPRGSISAYIEAGYGDYFNIIALVTNTVIVKSNPEDSGFVTGGGTFIYGETATVLASETENWLFDVWTDENGEIVSNTMEFTFEVIEDVVLTANFLNSRIKNNNVGQFSIYLSPDNDILTIDRFTAGKARIQIYNSIGLLVLTQTLEDNETKMEISVKSMPAGVYIISLIDNCDGIYGKNKARPISTQRFIIF